MNLSSRAIRVSASAVLAAVLLAIALEVPAMASAHWKSTPANTSARNDSAPRPDQAPQKLIGSLAQAGLMTPTVPFEWTEEEMRKAIPFPLESLETRPVEHPAGMMPQDVGDPGWAPSRAPDTGLAWPELTNNPPFTVTPPGFVPTLYYTSTHADQVVDFIQFPYSTVGKVFFTRGGFNYICSAAVIGENAIWTAGHCVNDGQGQFHKNWIFVPNFYNFRTPYPGPWVAAYAIAPTQFTAHLDRRFDYAVVIVKPIAERTIRQTTGALGFAWNLPREQPWVALGYPSITFGGFSPVISYGAYTEVDTRFGEPYPFGIGSNMKSGASGGPWLLNVAEGKAGEANYLGGVNSYITPTYDIVYTPYLGDLAKRLWDCAQASTSESLDCGTAPMTGVALTKLSSSDGVAPGAPFTYTLVIQNHGTLAAPDLRLTDTLPAGVALAGVELPGGTCGAASSVVTCTLDTLASGDSVTATLVVTAPAETGVIVNMATVSSGAVGEFTTNYYSTQASVSTAIHEADLVLDKATSSDIALPNTPLTYTLTLHNKGPLAATNVALTDTLPLEFTFDSADLPGGSCSQADSVVTCTLSTLAAGESITATVVVTTPDYAAIITNFASVTADQSDALPDNNLDIYVDTPIGEADIALTSTVSIAAVQVGTPFTYLLTLENHGPLAATTIDFYDTLPTGVTFVSADLPGGDCTMTDGEVACTLSTLAAGGSVTATIKVIAPMQAITLTNAASVIAEQEDVNTDNDVVSLDTRVDACWAHLNASTTNYYPLQAAIDAAHPGDVVKVAGTCAGVIQRAAPPGYSGITPGQTAYITQSLTLRGGYTVTNWTTANATVNPTTLDALGQGRALFIAGDGISVTVEGLRFTGGDAWKGGGGMVWRARVTLRDTTFTGNDAFGGSGGLYLLQSPQVVLSHNTFSDNSAVGDGGGLVLGQCPNASLSDNLFEGNNLRQVSSEIDTGNGGGLYIKQSDQIVVRRNTFSNNRGGGLLLWNSSQAALGGNTFLSNTASSYYSSLGGGLSIRSGSQVVVSGNTFDHNTSAAAGGGLAIRPNPGFYTNIPGVNINPNAVISGNIFTANTAIHGGGLYVSHSPTATLNNNLIFHNSATGGGGLFLNKSQNVAVINTIAARNAASTTASEGYIQSSSARLLHTTLAGSTAGYGLYVDSASTAALTNTILVSQTVGIHATEGSTATLNGVLWFGNTDNTGGAGSIDVTNDLTGAPAFVDPDGDDYHLRAGSAALFQGVDAGVRTDIDGDVRSTTLPDLGADEFIKHHYLLPLVTRSW